MPRLSLSQGKSNELININIFSSSLTTSKYTKDSGHYGELVFGVTGYVPTFEYVPNNTSTFTVTLERESGEFVFLEV